MERLKIKSSIVAVVERANGSIDTFKTKNIVTDTGDQYYAEKLAGIPFFTVAGIRLGEGVTAATKSDIDVSTFINLAVTSIDSGYPLTADTDSRNTGAGLTILTWRCTFALDTFTHLAVSEGALVDDLASPINSLNHFIFAAPFEVTSVDIVTIFINHDFIGV